MSDFDWRNADLADMDAIMEVESNWPEAARATEDKFRARLEKFPQGFFIAFDRSTGNPAATITCMPADYEPTDLSDFKDWDAVTNYGFLPDSLSQEKGNALYVVSGVIATEYRGHPLFDEALGLVVDLARRLNKSYVLAGAVIPGYDRFANKHPDVSAGEYCFRRRGSHLVDPLLAMYEKIGFSLPDERHVIGDYFPDAGSRNHGALVLRRI